ncbi:MAG: helix-turn-helix transcriptional regulator [Alphaproteobacteria bacterium]
MTPNHIRFWRQKRGWTLQQLAEAAGTTKAQVDKLERGSRRLTVDWMVRLAKPLGCDPRALMLADGGGQGAAREVKIPVALYRRLEKCAAAAEKAVDELVVEAVKKFLK